MSIKKALLPAVLLVPFVFGVAVAADDGYQQLASEISQAGESLGNKKIAIIPFSYADGRSATKDGSVISERLTMKMIKLQKFEIIERSVLDKVMAELKLQASGVIDASSAQQLGKVLGVEAIVTGTLVETSGGQIEVNARLIKTETAQAIGASQVTLDKDWVGDASAMPQQGYQQPAYQQPTYQSTYQQPAAQTTITRAPYVRGKYEYGFFDIFMGFGSPNMDLKFENTNSNITLTNQASYSNNDLGIWSSSFGSGTDFRSVEFSKLSTEGVGPIAFRVGGFGKGAVGGDFELSYEKRNTKQQTAAWKLNGSDAGNVTFSSNDYATVKSFGMSGDILFRHAGQRVDPYFGIGLGLSLNSIELPYVKGFTESSAFVRPVNDFGVGLMFRIPAGLRIRLGDKTQLVTELRYEMNHIFFDRGGIAGESDTITLSGVKFNAGLGFTF